MTSNEMDVADAEMDRFAERVRRVAGPHVDDPARQAGYQATASALEGRRLVTEAAFRFKKKHPLGEDEPSSSNADANATSSTDTRANKRRLSKGTSVRGLGPNESAEEMLLRLSNEFQPIVEQDWDTVIYIGPPPQEHQQDDYEYEYIRQHFSKPYLMNSQTLKDSGSKRLLKFLGPMSARAERRLKKLGIHQQIPQDRKAKYYIDLRPMQDEDEALLMITELTCTPGILGWHMSHLASGVPKELIGGKDDLNITSKPHARSWIEVDDTVDTDIDGVKEDTDSTEDDDGLTRSILDLEPDYSALRHWTTIERLLHALVGRDPKLNSAPKVWTYFAIAKFFDCATYARVTNWIYDWIFTNNNSNFIQANPETAYRMALGMHSPDILRASFSMLVGERALMQAGRNVSDSATLNVHAKQISLHGRNIYHLDDDEVNRIDHAALSLTRRMTNFFNSIANSPLDWTAGRTELAMFRATLNNYEDRSAIEPAFNLLHDYIRGEIYQALSQNVEEGDLMRLYRTKGFKEFGWLKRSQSFATAYNNMSLPQRLLTQSFWSQLENYGLYQESEKTIAWSRGHSLDGLHELAPDFNGQLQCVSKRLLCTTIEEMNGRLVRDKAWVRATGAVRHMSPKKTKAGDSDSDDDQVQWKTLAEREAQEEPELRNPFMQLPHVNQEIFRAMQGLGKPHESGAYSTSPYNNGTYDPNFPYTSVANRHRLEAEPVAIRPAILLAELSVELRRRIMKEVLTPGYVNDEFGIESEISISQMDILMCLNEDEWKYLPLWAGGLDDGTGGVFAEIDVPDMEAIEGFRGGKMGLDDIPGLGEGSVDGSYTMVDGSDDFDEIKTDEGISTVGKASRIATDGTTSAGASTVMSLDE